MTTQLYHMYMIKFRNRAHELQHQDMNVPVQTMFNTIKPNQTQNQLLFMVSPSDLLATPSSEYLQERCSRHRH